MSHRSFQAKFGRRQSTRRRFAERAPGHGPKADGSLVAANRRYLDEVGAAWQPIASAEGPARAEGDDPRIGQALAAAGERFPSYRSPYLLSFSAQQYVSRCAP